MRDIEELDDEPARLIFAPLEGIDIGDDGLSPEQEERMIQRVMEITKVLFFCGSWLPATLTSLEEDDENRGEERKGTDGQNLSRPCFPLKND